MKSSAASSSLDNSLTEEPTLGPPELTEQTLAEREARYPVGAELTREVLEDGLDSTIWHRLRQDEPVTWCPALEAWLVTRRAWGAEMFRSPEAFTVFTTSNVVRRVLGEQMLVSDGERHDRQRRPFDLPFKAAPVRTNYVGLVRRQVDDAIAEHTGKETLDLGAWASRFAVSTIAEVIGLAAKEPEELRQMYDSFASAMEYGAPDEAERLAASEDAKARFADLLTADLARVTERPDESILSHVAQHEQTGGLSGFEVIQNVRLILFGAIETIESMIVNTLWLLLNNPDAMRAVRSDRDLVANAVEESLRLIPPVGIADRFAAHDLTFHGADIQAGEMVFPVIIALNRDPDSFADPDVFEVERTNARAHYSLSHGKHFCLGANLARVQGEAVVSGFLDAFESIELDPRSGAPGGFEFRRVSPVILKCR